MKIRPRYNLLKMFAFADKNKSGRLSYREFQLMVNPPDLPERARPRLTDLTSRPQVIISPTSVSSLSSLSSPSSNSEESFL